MSDLNVVDNRGAHRYEATLPGGTAFATYQQSGDQITFTHTIVPESMENQGVGSALVEFALNDARSRGLKVIPECPFVAAYIERHPQYQDLVQA